MIAIIKNDLISWQKQPKKWFMLAKLDVLGKENEDLNVDHIIFWCHIDFFCTKLIFF